MIGPNVQIHSVTHPVHWKGRQGRHGPSLCPPVCIGDDCCLGGGVIVLPGVNIENGSVIGAGSVVTRGIPAGHVAAGNPARLLRRVGPDVEDAEGVSYDAAGKVVQQISGQTHARAANGDIKDIVTELGKLRQDLEALETPVRDQEVAWESHDNSLSTL